MPYKYLVWVVWWEWVWTIPVAGLRCCGAICAGTLVLVQKTFFISYSISGRNEKTYVGRQ
jgi:hypothetical protein